MYNDTYMEDKERKIFDKRYSQAVNELQNLAQNRLVLENKIKQQSELFNKIQEKAYIDKYGDRKTYDYKFPEGYDTKFNTLKAKQELSSMDEKIDMLARKKDRYENLKTSQEIAVMVIDELKKLPIYKDGVFNFKTKNSQRVFLDLVKKYIRQYGNTADLSSKKEFRDIYDEVRYIIYTMIDIRKKNFKDIDFIPERSYKFGYTEYFYPNG